MSMRIISYSSWYIFDGLSSAFAIWYLFSQDFISPKSVGVIQAVYVGSYPISIVLCLKITSVTSRVNVFLVSAFANIALLLSSYLTFLDVSRSMVGTAMFFLSFGVLSGIGSIVFDSFIPELANKSPQVNSAIAGAAVSVSKLFGFLIGILLAREPSDCWLLSLAVLLAGAAVMFSIGFCGLSSGPVERNPTQGLGFPLPLNNSQRHILFGITGVGFLIVPSCALLIPLMFREKFPLHVDLVQSISLFIWLSAALSSMVLLKYLRRIERLGRLAILFWSIASLVLPCLAISKYLPTYLALVFVLGVSFIGRFILVGPLLKDSPPGDRVSLVALEQGCFWTAGAVGSYLLGMAIEVFGTGPSALIVSILLCIVLAFLASGKRRRLWNL